MAAAPVQQPLQTHPSTAHITTGPARPPSVSHGVSTRMGGMTGQESGMTTEPKIASGPEAGVGNGIR